MSRIQCRGAIACAAVVFAPLASRRADAQFFVNPGPMPPSPVHPHSWGMEFPEVATKAIAERCLPHAQEKLLRDSGRRHSACVNYDVHKINKLEYCIAVDDWLIRKIRLQDPGCYPYPYCIDPISNAAIAQYRAPRPAVYPMPLVPAPEPVATAPKTTITILNSEPKGAGVGFSIDGMAHQSTAGSSQILTMAPGSTISYESGGSLGHRQYELSAGRYEFRSTPEGWELYKLSGTR